MGRSNYQFFTESLNIDAQERLSLENDLRDAIDKGDFELYYQPQMGSLSHEVCGAEVLLRWNHPTRGMVPPDIFIRIAEESNLILPLGEWVLEEACRQQQQWRTTFKKQIKVAVNISPQQLASGDIASLVKMLMKKYDMGIGDLSLEVTETAAMENPDQAIARLKEIRELGVELAIDDFGTGYSSLAYLKLLPIQTLKLARAFVSDIEDNIHVATICSASIGLSHNLGFNVVAEGVETKEQEDFLIDLGCEVIQGYYFCRPISSHDVELFMFKPKLDPILNT